MFWRVVTVQPCGGEWSHTRSTPVLIAIVNTLDLSAASHERLLALIAEQQAVIAQEQAVIQELQRRIAALEEQLRRSGSGGAMPGTKPKTTRSKERKEQRKPRPRGFARQRMTPT